MAVLKAALRRALHAPALWRALGPLLRAAALLPAGVSDRLACWLAFRMPKEVARDLLLERMPRHSACAEIGVWKGDFSARILARVQPRALHLIDPWLFQPQFPTRMYGGNVAVSQADMDAIHRGVEERFAGHPNVVVHRVFSTGLVQAVGEGTLDWAYIDGNHSLDAVRHDLALTWRALRPGGWVTGDDYFWEDADGSCGVRQAVDAFAGERGLRVEFIGSQFLLRKP